MIKCYGIELIVHKCMEMIDSMVHSFISCMTIKRNINKRKIVIGTLFLNKLNFADEIIIVGIAYNYFGLYNRNSFLQNDR